MRPMTSARFRPIRSEMRPAGREQTTQAVSHDVSVNPIKPTSKPKLIRYRLYNSHHTLLPIEWRRAPVK